MTIIDDTKFVEEYNKALSEGKVNEFIDTCFDKDEDGKWIVDNQSGSSFAYNSIDEIMDTGDKIAIDEIINPNNEQSIVYAFDSVSFLDQCVIEKEMTLTDQYYDWKSELTQTIDSTESSSNLGYLDNTNEYNRLLKEFRKDLENISIILPSKGTYKITKEILDEAFSDTAKFLDKSDFIGSFYKTVDSIGSFIEEAH